ncbi:MAG: tyrosine-type recombinase/integrase [Bacteroidota bacterium]
MHTLRGQPKMIKDGRGRYQLVVYDPDTKRRKWRSLQTSRKDIATVRFRRLAEAYDRGEWNPWREAPELKATTLKAAADRFLEAKRETCRASTVRTYRGVLDLLMQSVPAGLLLRDVEERDCQRLVRRPDADASRRTYHRHLGLFLRWCVDQGLLSENPMAALRPPRRTRREAAFFTRDEFAGLLTGLEQLASSGDLAAPVVHQAARLAIATGIRRGALVALQCGDVDPGRGFVFVRNRKGFRTKSGDDRAVPLSAMALAVYDELGGPERPRSEPLLRGVRGGPVCPQWLGKAFKKRLRTLGLAEELHWHSLRHSFVSWLAMGGVDAYQIKAWAGHASLSTTEKYMHLAPSKGLELRRVIDGHQGASRGVQQGAPVAENGPLRPQTVDML